MLSTETYGLGGLLILSNALLVFSGLNVSENDEDFEYDFHSDEYNRSNIWLPHNLSSVHGDHRRVVRGWNSGQLTHPWLVQLWPTPNTYHCTGSIVHSGYILTCAHCVSGYNPVGYTVIAGTIYLNGRDGVRYNVRNFIIHPQWDRQHVNDIALIRLTAYVRESNRVGIVRVANRPWHPPGSIVNFAGWGRLANGEFPQILQEINLRIVSAAQCDNLWGGGISCCNNFCTTTPQGYPGACFGDSGAPIVHNRYVIGMFHKLDQCGNGRPDVHFDIPVYYNWISGIIGN